MNKALKPTICKYYSIISLLLHGKKCVKAFITLHSYSQMWLIPYGHRKRSYPQDFHTALRLGMVFPVEDLATIAWKSMIILFRPLALRATKALYEMYGTKYQVGTGADLMYEASGSSHDWAKGSLKVNYAYLIELRPKNTLMGYGFLLPEREIPATGLETFEAIKIVADELIGQFIQPEIRKRVQSSSTRPSIEMRRGYKVIETTRKKPVPHFTKAGGNLFRLFEKNHCQPKLYNIMRIDKNPCFFINSYI
uniref:Peptidase_M14 domain-containing protein n=1 Tax=Heterorhabditis bacteriophora TaxID=37862 RepID=A0A1I7WPF4_HETBA